MSNVDLFSYFGVDSDSTSAAPTKDSSETATSGAQSTQSESTAQQTRKVRGAGHPQKPANDSCDDGCAEESELLEDEPEENEAAADAAELRGQSGNTEVRKSGGSADAEDKGKKEEKKPVFNHVTYICYAGQKFLITKFFDQDALPKLELEDVRKRLEKDFPEMSKSRTRMDWDEKKNIICPMIVGGKKGSFSQGLKGFFFRSKDLFEKKEPINILAAQDGYYELRENDIGVFIVKAPVVEELEPCREGFKMKLPKIPALLFSRLVSFFADYAENNVEVMGVFYWDSEQCKYVLDVPRQRVTKVSVDPSFSDVPMHYIKVAEIHSHNTMNAFFSEVDDADELGTMLYGVVGRLWKNGKTIGFDMQTRAGVAGRFIHIDPGYVIGNGLYTGPNVFEYVEYPDDWHDRVQIKRRAVGGYKHD